MIKKPIGFLIIFINMIHIYFFAIRFYDNPLYRIALGLIMSISYLVIIFLKKYNKSINSVLEMINIMGLISILYWMSCILEDASTFVSFYFNESEIVKSIVF